LAKWPDRPNTYSSNRKACTNLTNSLYIAWQPLRPTLL
jgi:hypothetical protein